MAAPASSPSPAGSTKVHPRLHRAAEFFLRQRHLRAIRDGVVGALPLVLIGSFFLLLAQPPSATLQRLVGPYAPTLLVPYRVLGGAIALYVTFGAAHSLAKSYELDTLSNGLLAVAAYLVAAAPSPVLSATGGAAPALTSLPLERLGASGIFTGLLLAIATVEISRLFVRRGWTLQLPQTAPEIVVRSFVALLPGLGILVSVFLIVHVLGVDVLRQLELLTRPLLRATGSLPAALAIVGVDSGLWLLGVHASAAVATLKPLWEVMLVQNMESVARGAESIPHIATLPFYLWFVWQGGSGTTLALGLLLLRARSVQLRGIGRASVLPALCNINEPILFGAPVVLNPQLALPFLLAPLAAATTSYVAFHFNWATRPYLEMPWTLPAPVGAFLSTGGDYRAVILQAVNLFIGLMIYRPFVRSYDRQLQHSETASRRAGSPPTLPTP